MAKTKRNGKFWRKNERDVMARLGLEPTKNSGSGWVEKGDGQNDHVVCELKSTDALSYRLRLEDLRQIEQHAMVANKLPVFAVQFLAGDELYLVLRPEMLADVVDYLKTSKPTVDVNVNFLGIDLGIPDGDTTVQMTRCISSGNAARIDFAEEQEKKYGKKERTAT